MSVRALLERPMIAHSASLVALRAGNLAARLGLLFVLARLVSPAAFGTVVFALSVAEIGKVIADFGMDTLAIRRYAAGRDPRDHAAFAASLAAAKFLFGAVVAAAIAGWFAWTQPAEAAAIGAIFALSVPTSLLANYALDWHQARLSLGRVVAPVVSAMGLAALAAAVAMPLLGDLRLQVALFPAIELVGGLALLRSLARGGLTGVRPSFAGVAALARASVPIAVTAILIVTYSRLDVLVLAGRLDATAVGHYGLAFRLTEPFQLAAAAFGLSVFSRFAAWFQTPGAIGLPRAVARYATATLAYGVAAALAVGAVAPPLLERFLPHYAPAIPVLRLLALGLVFRCLNATLSGILQGAGRFRLLTLIACGNLVVVFTLLHLWVGLYGASGAALALLVAEALNSAVQMAIVARRVAPRPEGAR